MGKIVLILIPAMLSLLHVDSLEDTSKRLLVLFLDGLSPEEFEVIWNTENR